MPLSILMPFAHTIRSKVWRSHTTVRIVYRNRPDRWATGATAVLSERPRSIYQVPVLSSFSMRIAVLAWVRQLVRQLAPRRFSTSCYVSDLCPPAYSRVNHLVCVFVLSPFFFLLCVENPLFLLLCVLSNSIIRTQTRSFHIWMCKYFYPPSLSPLRILNIWLYIIILYYVYTHIYT